MKNPPNHIAIIMDGNGRWAKKRSYPRHFGHIRGARVARKIITESTKLKVPYLTLYAFSSENWSRPASEVGVLMKLLARNLKRELKTLMDENIRFNCIGDHKNLPGFVKDEIDRVTEATQTNQGLVLTFAVSYGGRQEIIEAVKKIAHKVKSSELNPDDPNSIDENLLRTNLPSSHLPDPDLIIRTSGEFRTSNFFTWQAAYSEYSIVNKLWPDFAEEDLRNAIADFQNRDRRFGRVESEKGIKPLNHFLQ
jgi:undecaprenyl diphosphate synthase